MFDFGSEVYVWFGKDATVRDRSIAPLLLTQLVDKGYDYRSVMAVNLKLFGEPSNSALKSYKGISAKIIQFKTG